MMLFPPFAGRKAGGSGGGGGGKVLASLIALLLIVVCEGAFAQMSQNRPIFVGSGYSDPMGSFDQHISNMWASNMGVSGCWGPLCPSGGGGYSDRFVQSGIDLSSRTSFPKSSFATSSAPEFISYLPTSNVYSISRLHSNYASSVQQGSTSLSAPLYVSYISWSNMNSIIQLHSNYALSVHQGSSSTSTPLYMSYRSWSTMNLVSQLHSNYALSVHQGSSSTYTHIPTMSPTTIRERDWQSKLDIIVNQTIDDHLYFNWLEFSGTVIQGTCSEYSNFLKLDLFSPYFEKEPKLFSVQVYDHLDQFGPEIRSCTDAAVLPKLLNSLIFGTSFNKTSKLHSIESYPCGGHNFVFRTCALNTATAICVDCEDPCTSECTEGTNQTFIMNSCGVTSNDICSKGLEGSYRRKLAAVANTTIIPTATPTIAPSISASPSTSPTWKPTLSPTATPTLSPTHYSGGMIRVLEFFFQTPVAPSIVGRLKMISKTNSSVTIDAKLNGPGAIYCGAFGKDFELKSYNDIKLQGFGSQIEKIDDVSFIATVELINLQPYTTYSVYCYTVGKKDALMPQDDIRKAKLVVATACCRIVEVNVMAPYVLQKSYKPNAISVSLGGIPVPSGSLTVNVTSIDLLPNVVVFDAKYKNTIEYFSIPDTATNNDNSFPISIKLGGSLADVYSVRFVSVRRNITVIGINSLFPAPALSSVQFSSSGASLLVSFDSDTNRGGSNNVGAEAAIKKFKCSELLDFPGADLAKCQWTSESSVLASLGSSATVRPKDECTLKDGVIQAACRPGSKNCSSWPKNSRKSVSIAGPESPLFPNPSILAPSVISACDSFYLDLSQSSGSGGRPWANIRFVVKDQDDKEICDICDKLEKILNDPKEFKIFPPTMLNGSLFEYQNAQYSITVELTNFLGRKKSAVVSFIVTSSITPSISISGPSTIQMTRKPGLFLQSDAFVSLCSQDSIVTSVTRNDININWEVTYIGNDEPDKNIVSIAKLDTNFKLKSYDLKPGLTYFFKAVAFYTRNMMTSSASAQVTVNVIPGSIISQISGGSTRGVKNGQNTTLDASGSYDEDGQYERAPKLQFLWTCHQSFPSFSGVCPLVLVTQSNGNNVTYLANASDAAGVKKISEIKVTVFDETSRVSTSVVSVIILEESAPVVSINSQFPQKINANERTIIEGSVDYSAAGKASWSVDYSAIQLNDIISGYSTADYSVGDLSPFSSMLVINPNNILPQGVILTFSLTAKNNAGGNSSYSTVSIVINGAPTPGLFYSDPKVGTELVDVFTLAASQWDDDDLPLTFAFGFIDNGKSQIVQARSPSTFCKTKLGAGQDSKAYNVSIIANIFDSLLAYSTINSTVKVNPIVSDIDKSAQIKKAIKDARSLNEKRQAVAISSSSMNKKSCKDVPDCMSLNRADCFDTANTCGRCLDGYFGSAGDANSKCINVTDRRRLIEVRKGSSFTSATLSDAIVPTPTPTIALPNSAFPTAMPTYKLQDCLGRSDKICGGVSQGSCHFFDVVSNLEITSCWFGDISCYPMCVCEDGFAGSSCSYTSEELELKKTTRLELLNSLFSVVTDEEISNDGIVDQANLVATVLSDVDQVPFDSKVLDLNNRILSNGVDLLISTDSMRALMLTVDKVVQAYISNMTAAYFLNVSSLNIDEIGVLNTNIIDILALFSNLSMSQSVVDLDNPPFLFDNFRVTSKNISIKAADSGKTKSVSLATPQNFLEKSEPQSVSVEVTGDVTSVSFGLSVQRSISRIFDKAMGSTSSPVTVYLNSPEKLCGNDCKMTLNLINNEPQGYVVDNPVNSKHGNCEIGKESTISLKCEPPYEDNLHKCSVDGNEMVDLTCPYNKKTPICSLQGDTDSDIYCTTGAFDGSSVECVCTLPVKQVWQRRLIDAAGETTSGATFYSKTRHEKINSSTVITTFPPTHMPTTKPPPAPISQLIYLTIIPGMVVLAGFVYVANKAYLRHKVLKSNAVESVVEHYPVVEDPSEAVLEQPSIDQTSVAVSVQSEDLNLASDHDIMLSLIEDGLSIENQYNALKAQILQLFDKSVDLRLMLGIDANDAFNEALIRNILDSYYTSSKDATSLQRFVDLANRLESYTTKLENVTISSPKSRKSTKMKKWVVDGAAEVDNGENIMERKKFISPANSQKSPLRPSMSAKMLDKPSWNMSAKSPSPKKDMVRYYKTDEDVYLELPGRLRTKALETKDDQNINDKKNSPANQFNSKSPKNSHPPTHGKSHDDFDMNYDMDNDASKEAKYLYMLRHLIATNGSIHDDASVDSQRSNLTIDNFHPNIDSIVTEEDNDNVQIRQLKRLLRSQSIRTADKDNCNGNDNSNGKVEEMLNKEESSNRIRTKSASSSSSSPYSPSSYSVKSPKSRAIDLIANIKLEDRHFQEYAKHSETEWL